MNVVYLSDSFINVMLEQKVYWYRNYSKPLQNSLGEKSYGYAQYEKLYTQALKS